MQAAFTLYRTLRKAGPFEVIHSHSSKAGALARLLSPLLRRSLQIYTPHAFVTLSPDASRLYGKIERALSHFGDAIIAVSRAEARHGIERLGISASRIHVIPNGIALPNNLSDTLPDNPPAPRIDPEIFTAGFVGRLEPQKNPARLIEAFALAQAQYPKMRLEIAGDGSLRAQLEALTRARGLEDRVVFLGQCNGREAMSAFDCLLCASDYEAFAITFLEALMAGVPVVTTPVGGAEEIAEEPAACLASPDFTPASLAESLLRLARETPAERARRRQLILRFAPRFSLEAMTEQTRQLYRRLGKFHD
jgi:glycosyltransferase involved in cell wall biosynthesis